MVFDIFDGFQDTLFTLSPDSPPFGSAGGKIDAVDGIGKHTGDRGTAVSDGVNFQESGLMLVPLVGFDRDLFFQY